ncbi:MAG: hypothetical protein KAH30_06000, partial [Caldisericia bacterium]|nr:hypothetical protein [Caldisericia bacterium]
MKKIVGLMVALFLVLSPLALPTLQTDAVSAAGETDVPAIFIANRFAPVGVRWNGNTLVAERTREFDGVGTAWGTTQYKMPGPGATLAINPMSARTDVVINVTPSRITTAFPSVQDDQRYSMPVYWTEFYLKVIPAQGESQEYERWFAVVDDMGQLWFDPDGRFHDSRYAATADPATEAYKYFGGTGNDNCKNNPHCKIDPSNANNTQGPYLYMPTTLYGFFNYGSRVSSPGTFTDPANYPIFNTDLKTGGLFFMPNTRYSSGAKRVFQVGFNDMPDFPLTRDGASTIALAGISRPSIPAIGTNLVDTVVGSTEVIVDTTVRPYETDEIPDWDISLPYVRFLDGFDATIPGPLPPSFPPGPPGAFGDNLHAPLVDYNSYFAIENDMFEYGEEWHSANVVLDPPPNQPGQPMQNFTGAQMDMYDPGEWIYRAGANMLQNPTSTSALFGYQWNDSAQTYDYAYYGCTRLTPVSMAYNGQFFNYAPGSIVRDVIDIATGDRGTYQQGDDADLLDPVTLLSPHILWRFPITDGNFMGPGSGPINIQHDAYETVHLDNMNFNPNVRCTAGINVYDPYEGIYMKTNTSGGATSIQEGDWRLTNVNGNTYSARAWVGWIGRDLGTFPAAGGTQERLFSLGGMWHGDALILSE